MSKHMGMRNIVRHFDTNNKSNTAKKRMQDGE